MNIFSEKELDRKVDQVDSLIERGLSPDEFLKFFKQGHKIGNPLASFYYAKIVADVSGDLEKWHEIIDMLLTKNYPPAFYWKANAYRIGYGVDQSSEEFERKLAVAAKLGHLHANNYLELHDKSGFFPILIGRIRVVAKLIFSYAKSGNRYYRLTMR